MARESSLKAKVAGVGVLIIGAFVVISLLLGVVAGWSVVQDGERGVYTRMGEVQGTVGPGFHLKVPLIDSIQTYEVRTQAYTMSESSGEGDKANRDDSIEALTQEGLNVNIDMTVRYHFKANQVDYLYQNVSTKETGVIERVVRPTAREAVRGCSAQFSVKEIYSSKRDEFSTCVSERVNKQYAQKGIKTETVQIRNIMLPRKVRQAIQEKQAAQQQIQTKKKKLEIAELEAERKRTEAKGIRDSQRIINQTLTDQYLSYLWITEGIEKGDPIYVPINNDGMQMFKDVDQTRGAGNNSTSSTETRAPPA